MAKAQSSNLLRVALVASNATSILLLALVALEWTIIDWLTLFGYLPFITTAMWLFAASGGFAILVLLLRFRTEGRRAGGPALVQALVLVALLTVPFTRISLDVDFRCYRADREHVVELVRLGRLGQGLDIVPLPATLAHVSRGGAVVVIAGGERPGVLFYTFRGVLDHYAGFLYSAADVPPDAPDEIPWREVAWRAPHWWWVSR